MELNVVLDTHIQATLRPCHIQARGCFLNHFCSLFPAKLVPMETYFIHIVQLTGFMASTDEEPEHCMNRFMQKRSRILVESLLSKKAAEFSAAI